MRLRSRTVYRLRDGRRRVIRLFKTWRNMRDRIGGCIGTKTSEGRAPIWKGLPTDFRNFTDFRAWALTAGYNRERNSLDRIDANGGYVRSNLRFVMVAENSRKCKSLWARRPNGRFGVADDCPF